ncbi:MAG: hypothetical protein JXR31_01830 [Prolixibacteraceae bacterium]|nr:hypothetical protein [Prolixibacteraceae bacterium]MBN2772959.1 hypothetical protein [Prolixibacteraceae bacterium]
MRKFLFVCFILIVGTTCLGQQIEPLKQNLVFKIDAWGNSDLEVSMQLNAAQWGNFKNWVGSNLSILKREIERSLPSYFLQDFQYEEQPMERSYTLKFKAFGVAKLKDKDKWLIEMDYKDPDVTPLSEDIYMITSNYAQDGSLLQQSTKIFFPKGAKNIKEETDAFGNAVFTYDCKIPSSGFPIFLVIGICLIISSAVLFVLKLMPVAKTK